MTELVRWDPFKAVAAPFDDLFAMPSLFRPMTSRFGSFGGRMDVAETDSAYELAVELPGVKKEAIQVHVYENSVTVNAEIPGDEQPGRNGIQWLLRERAFGKFSRTITLPEAVDDEASEARYADGVLHLLLKKKSASQARRLAIH